MRLRQSGSYMSMFGSRITTIACPLLALYLTNSPVAAGIVGVRGDLSQRLCLPAGRCPRGALGPEANPAGLRVGPGCGYHHPAGAAAARGPAAPQALPLPRPGERT